MENQRIIISGLAGGTVAAILNAVPFLNFINCFCCIGIMLGGAVALAYYDYTIQIKEYLSPAIAVTLGITSGIIGAFISLIILFPRPEESNTAMAMVLPANSMTMARTNILSCTPVAFEYTSGIVKSRKPKIPCPPI